MSMIEMLALSVVVLTGLYFMVLAVVALFMPDRANRFLLGFADTAIKHYSEIFMRFVVGAALIRHAPRMLFPEIFTLFGWVLLITTACLLLIPWRWHDRFARLVVPRAARYIMLIGLSSLALGAFILAAVVLGGRA